MYKSSQFAYVVAIGLFIGISSTVLYLGTRKQGIEPTFTTTPTSKAPTVVNPPPEEKVEPEVRKPLPTSALLEVPFYPQAPFGRWDAIHKETCEEASLLMVYTYKKKEPVMELEVLDRKLINFVEWQTLSGYGYDVTVKELRDAARSYLGFDGAEIIKNPTAEQIEQEIVDGNPVIIPAAGRLLPNPYFTPPGPRYHMLVVIGYDNDEFITNDPGTRRGKHFRYQKNDLLNAIHDYTAGDITTGSRNILVYR